MSWGLVWFRNDLRVRDHEALLTACLEHAGRIIPVYVFDKRQVGPHARTRLGQFSKCSTPRAQFLVEAVQDLANTLRTHYRGMQLLVYKNALPENVIPKLIAELSTEKQVHVGAVYYHREVCSEERAVEDALRAALCALNQRGELPAVTLRALDGSSTLYHADDLPSGASVGNMPPVFTSWRKLVEKGARIRAPLPMPDPAKVQPLPLSLDCDPIPTCAREVIGDNCEQARLRHRVPWTLPDDATSRVDPRHACPFRGGESAAQERVQAYTFGTDAIARYKATRNGLLGTEYSTKWSPYLALGNVTPRQLYAVLRRYETERPEKKGISTYWVLFELEWRDFFRFTAMRYGNALFWRRGLQAVLRGDPQVAGRSKTWRHDAVLLDRWQTGMTGFPLVDANQRELLATGWMSNRGRQNVASFLTKDLEIDWRLGAEWFESLLLDYDACSNYGNWQYAAGVGLDPRADRHFDVIRQARMYDPEGHYMRRWLPELESCTDWSQVLHLHEHYPEYPAPVVRHLHGGRKNLDDAANAPKCAVRGTKSGSRGRRQTKQTGKPHREPGWMRQAHTGAVDILDNRDGSAALEQNRQTVLDAYLRSQKR